MTRARAKDVADALDRLAKRRQAEVEIRSLLGDWREASDLPGVRQLGELDWICVALAERYAAIGRHEEAAMWRERVEVTP